MVAKLRILDEKQCSIQLKNLSIIHMVVKMETMLEK